MKKSVLVIAGGDTPEYTPSIDNGRYVANLLDRSDLYDVAGLYDFSAADPVLSEERIKNSAADIVFVAHIGGEGEDGTIQRFLDKIGIPYTHSGFIGANLGNDKAATKHTAAALGIPVLKTYFVGHLCDLYARYVSFPCVVKPVFGGSSIGVLICDKEEDMTSDALERVGRPDDIVIVEEKADTTATYTVAVVKDSAMSVAEQAVGVGFFDYKAKTDWYGCVTHAPAKVSHLSSLKMRSYALKIHKACACRTISRSDFIMHKGVPHFLEINTHPVLNDRSLRINGLGVEEYSDVGLIHAILSDVEL